VFPDVSQHPALRGFEILGSLGAGATGQVFLAKSRAGRKVAIKVLHERREDDGDDASHEGLAREATLCVRLNHPAIVQVRAFVEEPGFAALVFDYVEGLPLGRLMRLAGVVGARLPDRVAWHIVERVLAALAYAHSQRDEEGAVAPIIHRDISPSNVLIDWTGDVKITDFGIAKMLGVSPATRYGLVKGTLGCMAPEQARGEPVDERADVYAAALLAWRLATGRLPFDPRMVEAELLRAMRYPNIRPLSALRSDLPTELVMAVDVALAPELPQRDILASELHRVVTRSVDVERGRAELSELLERWRAHLERVKRKDSAVSSSDSSGDRRIPTLKYEEVDLLEAEYPTDSPTVEATALPGDELAWTAGPVPASGPSRSSALPVLTVPPSAPTSDSDSERGAVVTGEGDVPDLRVLRLRPSYVPTPLSVRGLVPAPKADNRKIALAVAAGIAILAALAWLVKGLL